MTENGVGSLSLRPMKDPDSFSWVVGDEENKENTDSENLPKRNNKPFNLMEAVRNPYISDAQDFLNKLLFCACEEGNAQSAKLLLQAGANPNAQRQSDGQALLHIACFHQSSKVIPLLVEHGAILNALNNKHQNPLFCVLMPKQPKEPSNEHDEYLNLLSMMHYKPSKPDVDTLTFLLEKGTDPSCIDIEGNSPLCLAVKSLLCSDDIISLLLQHGADTTAKYQGKQTILHVLMKSMPMNTSTIHCLIQHGVPLDEQDENGDTALHLAHREDEMDSGITSALELINAGAAVNISNARGETPLHLFVNVSMDEDGERLELIESLLDHGAAVNCMDENGDTPLHVFCDSERQDDYMDLFHTLVEAGCDVNSRNKKGSTPLHTVCGGTWLVKSYETVELLIGAEAEVDLLNHEMLTPLMLCCKKRFKDGQKTAIMETLIAQGADVYAKSPGGNSLLSLVCYDRKESPETIISAIKLLLDAGLTVGSEGDEFTPLHVACLTQNLTAARTLLEDYSADARQATHNGSQTPLHCTLLGNTKRSKERDRSTSQIVSLLLKHKADPNAQNSTGDTPLAAALMQDRDLTIIYEMIRMTPISSLQQCFPKFGEVVEN